MCFQMGEPLTCSELENFKAGGARRGLRSAVSPPPPRARAARPGRQGAARAPQSGGDCRVPLGERVPVQGASVPCCPGTRTVGVPAPPRAPTRAGGRGEDGGSIPHQSAASGSSAPPLGPLRGEGVPLAPGDPGAVGGPHWPPSPSGCAPGLCSVVRNVSTSSPPGPCEGDLVRRRDLVKGPRDGRRSWGPPARGLRAAGTLWMWEMEVQASWGAG